MKEQIEQFCEALEQAIVSHNAVHFPNLHEAEGVSVTAEYGRKYARIVRRNVQRTTGEEYGACVHCFVEISTGNILKAATWSAPAKHARGNISDPNMGIGTAVGVYGAAYL